MAMTPTLRSILLLAPLTCLLLSQCTVAPRPGDKTVTQALAAPKSGALITAAKRLEAGRPKGHSSMKLLVEAKESLDWRLALIDSAQSSIDIQLYLWHRGASSTLLLDRVFDAADRGVRVRILVDDFLFNSNEKLVSAICLYHPNIDIRIFNPTLWRGNPLGSAAEFILNFQHLNRRMHNKTWTVDRTFTIVGGRNVGDHYYGLDEKYNFIDLDVMVAGPVVEDVSDGFDLFWNSAQAYPGKLLSKRAKPEDVDEIKAQIAQFLADEKDGLLQSFPTERRDWSREFASLPAEMATGKVRFLQDHPDPEQDERSVVTSLRAMTNDQDGELIFVTPYLIPAKESMDRLEAEVKGNGLEVGILAPSLAANNQPAAHAKYKLKRKRILEGGARLFEMRPDPPENVRAYADVPPVRSGYVALHAKAVVGDRERCFIGSLNLDPRAVDINTESGMLIDCPELSQELLDLLRRLVESESAWQVVLDERGKLRWTLDGEVLNGEPPAPFSKRFVSFIVGWLPIESQL
jgi:putative cardiolipin synthase